MAAFPAVLATLLLVACAVPGGPRAPASASFPSAAFAGTDAAAAGADGADGADGDWTTRVEPVLSGHDPARRPAEGEADTTDDFLRPYLWMAGVEGDLTARGTEAEVDASFGDILDQLDLGLMVAYEHRAEGGWSFLLDVFYTSLGEDTTGPLGNEIDTTLELACVQLSGAFPLDGPGSVEAIAGARTWYTSIDLEVAGFGGDKRVDWVDPLVGLRWATELCEGWTLGLRGDVGGFGIGSASELSWQAQAVALHPLGERTSLAIGYRYLDVDRERGSGADETEVDLALHGVLLGIEYRF